MNELTFGDKLLNFLEKGLVKIEPWFYEHGIKIIVFLIVIYIIKKVIHKIIDKAVRIAVVADKYSTPEAELQRENTLISIFSNTVDVVLIVTTILVVLKEIGLDIGPLLAGAGIIGLAVGFGGQYLIRDIISGLFIILENQYRVGDVVNFDGTTGGKVENITLRMTTLRDNSGIVHHVPHGDIKRVSNLSKELSRINMDIGVSYNTDIDTLEAVINKVGTDLAKDPEWEERVISPPVFIRVDSFSENSIIVKVNGDTAPQKQWEVAGEFRKRLKKAFDDNNIELPFPQRVIHFTKDDSNIVNNI